MSTIEEQKIERRLKQIIPLGWAIIVGAFSVGGWVASLELRHRSVEEVAQLNEAELQSMAVWKVKTDANRFDAKQGNDMSNAFTMRSNIQDLKIQKLESGQQEIQKSLERIEDKLGTN